MHEQVPRCLIQNRSLRSSRTAPSPAARWLQENRLTGHPCQFEPVDRIDTAENRPRAVSVMVMRQEAAFQRDLKNGVLVEAAACTAVHAVFFHTIVLACGSNGSAPCQVGPALVIGRGKTIGTGASPVPLCTPFPCREPVGNLDLSASHHPCYLRLGKVDSHPSDAK